MKTTNVSDLMKHLLEGLNGVMPGDIKVSHYTSRGTECMFEFNGSFYRVTLEHMPTKENHEPNR